MDRKRQEENVNAFCRRVRHEEQRLKASPADGSGPLWLGDGQNCSEATNRQLK